ncbi:MAG: endonuclease/exonuclease/phosphatase family protein [Gammaproteobacteria bacterium]
MKKITESSEHFRVLTYNIHKGFSAGNFRFVLHQIREAIETEDVDLVFLQEIQGEHERKKNRINEWPSLPQFEFLADKMWPHYAYGKNAVYYSGHHGNAILSKYPIIHWENINVSSSKRASRSLLHAVINVPHSKKYFHVFCIHLALRASERRRQLRVLSHRIKTQVPAECPLIIAGDFNDWLGQADKSINKQLGLSEVFETLTGERAKTFPVWWPVLPVDRIYFRNLNAENCDCLNSKTWRKLSDHAALHAGFSLLKP